MIDWSVLSVKAIKKAHKDYIEKFDSSYDLSDELAGFIFNNSFFFWIIFVLFILALICFVFYFQAFLLYYIIVMLKDIIVMLKVLVNFIF